MASKDVKCKTLYCFHCLTSIDTSKKFQLIKLGYGEGIILSDHVIIETSNVQSDEQELGAYLRDQFRTDIVSGHVLHRTVSTNISRIDLSIVSRCTEGKSKFFNNGCDYIRMDSPLGLDVLLSAEGDLRITGEMSEKFSMKMLDHIRKNVIFDKGREGDIHGLEKRKIHRDDRQRRDSN